MTETVGEAVRAAAERLSATSDTARLDAELLMAHALGTDRSRMLLQHMADPAPESFDKLVGRRAAREPVAYITGRAEFYGLDLIVTADVLIPRGDSETLIDSAREVLAGRPPLRILDLGTGPGTLLLAALGVWPEAEGLGVDASAEALFVAVRNAQRLGNTPIGLVGPGPHEIYQPRPDRGFARFIQRDWREAGWADDLGQFDLVLCNPPYVEVGAALDPDVRDYEPAGALFAGPEGLDDYRAIVPRLGKLLLPGGVAIFEIGATQTDSVTAIARESGFEVALRRDLAGRPRALILR